MKLKTFLLVSQVVSFRHTKQTSKNVADTTFKLHKSDVANRQVDILLIRRTSIISTQSYCLSNYLINVVAAFRGKCRKEKYQEKCQGEV